MRKMHAVNDVMDLLQFCKVAKERNSKFQYAFTTDEEKRLKWRKRLVLPQIVQKKRKTCTSSEMGLNPIFCLKC